MFWLLARNKSLRLRCLELLIVATPASCLEGLAWCVQDSRVPENVCLRCLIKLRDVYGVGHFSSQGFETQENIAEGGVRERAT